VRSLSEKFLLFRIRTQKDQKAFEDFYQKFSPSLYRFFLLKLPTVQDAEEGVSTAFLRLWNYLTGPSKVESIGGLVFTVARGVAADFYREHGKEKEEALEEVEKGNGLEASNGHPERELREKMDARLEAIELRKVLQRLGEKECALLTLRFLEDWTVREIAKQFDQSENATRVGIHRALKALRNHIDITTFSYGAMGQGGRTIDSEAHGPQR